MNRVTALIIAAIAIATGGYLFWDSLQGPAPTPEDSAPEDSAPDAPAAGEETGAAEDESGGLGQALEGTMDAIGDAAESGLAPPESVRDAPPAETVEDSVEGALPSPETGTLEAAEELDPPVENAASTLPGGADPEILTPEGFDRDAVLSVIAASDLGDAQKATLRAALEGVAADSPRLGEVLDRIREALGL